MFKSDEKKKFHIQPMIPGTLPLTPKLFYPPSPVEVIELTQVRGYRVCVWGVRGCVLRGSFSWQFL